MSFNPSNQTPDNNLVKTIREMRSELRNLKTNQNSTFFVPHYTADPASPTDNQMWVNDTSHTLKIRLNGVTKTVTVT